MADITQYTELLSQMTEIMSVSGFEKLASEKLNTLIGKYFDCFEQDSVGNMLFYKYSDKEDAPLIMLDAHFDTVGFLVSEIKDDGKLAITPVGGIDTDILPFSEVTVYEKENLYGILTCSLEESGSIPADKIYIDTGYTAEEIKKLVSVGDGVTYRTKLTEIMNKRLIGFSFDDKACAAALVCELMSMPKASLKYNVCLSLSSREEVGGGGAAAAGKRIRPDAAIVTDVNFAAAPGVPKDESAPLGGGAMISLSAVTDRILTEKLINLAHEEGIPISPVIEAVNTGTNATLLYAAGEGIPCAVLSLPLAGMHTASECISMSDVKSFCTVIKAALSSDSLI